MGSARVAHRLKRAGSEIRSRYRLQVYARVGPIPDPERWAFIVACPDSGTTLLKILLGSHPAVATMPAEGHRLTDQLFTAKSVGMPRLYALQPELFRLGEDGGHGIDVDRIKRQWGHRFNDLGRPVLLDDSPTNAARSRWLQRHFEPASFIFLVRNGFAVAEGIRRRVSHPIDVAAAQWLRSNEFMLEDLPHLDRVHSVRYEDLSERPDEVLEGTLRFLDLDPSGFTVSDRVWKVHHRSGPIANMNAESLARLSQEDRSEIEQVAGPLLREFGYPAGNG
jgi:hypothetical protein